MLKEHIEAINLKIPIGTCQIKRKWKAVSPTEDFVSCSSTKSSASNTGQHKIAFVTVLRTVDLLF